MIAVSSTRRLSPMGSVQRQRQPGTLVSMEERHVVSWACREQEHKGSMSIGDVAFEQLSIF